MAYHELKVWPEFFSALLHGSKTFEIRKNDRGYAKGDSLTLREWCPDKEAYTGRACSRRVTYIMDGGGFGLERGFIAMAIR